MSDSIRDFIGRGPNDWPTEHEENGNYLILCKGCGCEAVGPKRAFRCWPCELEGRAEWDTLTEEQKNVRAAETVRIITKIFQPDFPGKVTPLPLP